MTMDEFHELKFHYDEHIKRWALSRAAFANAHFRGPDDPVWLWQDFLGDGGVEGDGGAPVLPINNCPSVSAAVETNCVAEA